MNMWKLEWKSSGASTDDQSTSPARLGKFSGRIVKFYGVAWIVDFVSIKRSCNHGLWISKKVARIFQVRRL